MKKSKLLALVLLMSISFSFSYFQKKQDSIEKIGVGIAYMASENGASNEGAALIGGAFAIESAVQGLLWGSVFGGLAGAAVGLGISL